MTLQIFKNIASIFKNTDNDSAYQALLRISAQTKNQKFYATQLIGLPTDKLLANDFPSGLKAFVDEQDELDLFKTEIDGSEQVMIGLTQYGLLNADKIRNPYLRELVEQLKSRYLFYVDKTPIDIAKQVWRSQKVLSDTLKADGKAIIAHHHYLYLQMFTELSVQFKNSKSNIVVDDSVSFELSENHDILVKAVTDEG